MTRYAKFARFGLISVLLAALAAPLAARAGTMTIYNKNCTKTANFATKQRVTVIISSKKDGEGCTSGRVTVHRGHSRVVPIAATDKDGNECGKYRHEAHLTILGEYDVSEHGDSHVTCKKDWLGVCQCTKD